MTKTRYGRILLAGLLAVASSFALSGTTSTFVVSSFVTLIVSLPVEVTNMLRQGLGNMGPTVGIIGAFVVTTGLFAATAALGYKVARDGYGGTYGRVVGVAVGGVMSLLLAFSLSKATVESLVVAATVTGYMLVTEFVTIPERDIDRSNRRTFLAELAGVMGFGGLSYYLGRDVTNVPTPENLTPIFGDSSALDPTRRGDTVASKIESARAKSLEIDGLPRLVTPAEEFFEFDVDRINPVVDVDTYTLSVTGAVETDLTIPYENLRKGPEEHRFITLRCVSDSLNGHNMDSALWTGIPVDPVLEAARPTGEYVMLHADDGYTEGFPLAALEGGFLAYEMNGEALPRKHGYPVRILIPGHWGEINVKWITEIEVMEEAAEGYWEKKGWHGTGPVKTVAKLWTVNHLDSGRVQVGGLAYAGTRGIDTVEVSIDEGRTWNEATLSPPLEAEDAWRQWVYEFRPPREEVDVIVRAIDGTGAIQSGEETDAFPSGPSGWVRKTVKRTE